MHGIYSNRGTCQVTSKGMVSALSTCQPPSHRILTAARPAGRLHRAYTGGSPYGEIMEGKQGELKDANFADFIVLSIDLTKIEPREYTKTKVLHTVVGGRVGLSGSVSCGLHPALFAAAFYFGVCSPRVASRSFARAASRPLGSSSKYKRYSRAASGPRSVASSAQAATMCELAKPL